MIGEDTNNNISNTTPTSLVNETEKQLTKAERKKLRRQEFKEQQKTERGKLAKKKFIKTIVGINIGIIILIGIVLLGRELTKEKLPSIDDDPFFGTGASVTVIEFGDFQCPFTRNFQSTTFKELKKKYGDKIKWVYRDMPTGRHEYSEEASLAAQCANEQGKFWEYHDLIFERGSADITSLRAYAKTLELNMQGFDDCIKSEKYLSEINNDYRAGKKAGVRITPTFFVNNIKLQGDVPLQTFQQIIESELNK